MESLQRRASASELLQQDAERARSDVIAADQPQAVDSLGVGQFLCVVDGVHAISRRIAWRNPREHGREISRSRLSAMLACPMRAGSVKAGEGIVRAPP